MMIKQKKGVPPRVRLLKALRSKIHTTQDEPPTPAMKKRPPSPEHIFNRAPPPPVTTPDAAYKVEELVRGAIYILKGGNICRYHGFWGNSKGPGLSFCAPSSPVDGTNGGYSAGIDEVIRKLTAADLGWLGDRREQMRVRNIGLEEIDFVINELSWQRNVQITKTACTKCEQPFIDKAAVVVRGKDEVCMPCAMHGAAPEGVTLVFRVKS